MLDLAVLFTSGYKKENVYFIPHPSEGLYVTYVLYQDKDKVRPWKPKDGDKMCRGDQGLRLKAAVLSPLLFSDAFSDCKIKCRLLPEQSKKRWFGNLVAI